MLVDYGKRCRTIPIYPAKAILVVAFYVAARSRDSSNVSKSVVSRMTRFHARAQPSKKGLVGLVRWWLLPNTTLLGILRRKIQGPWHASEKDSAPSNPPCSIHVYAPVTMKFLLTGLTALAALSSSANALYFYLDGTTPKCFYEELPKDTLVVGPYRVGSHDMFMD